MKEIEELASEMVREYHYSAGRTIVNTGCLIALLCVLIGGGTLLVMQIINWIAK